MLQGWFRRVMGYRLASFTVCLALAACGGGDDTTSTTTPTTTTTSTSTSTSLALSASTYSVAQSAGTVTITVDRTGSLTAATNVSYATANGTAVAGTDFTGTSGVLNWAANDSAAKTFTVAISNATAFAGSKNFAVNLSAPATGATVGSPSTAQVTITGSNGPGTVQFAAATASVVQSAGSVTLSVTRAGGSGGAVSVAYATSDGSAVAGTQYTSTSGTLNWASGDSAAKSIAIPVSASASLSGNVTFNVTLSSPGGGATLGTTVTDVVTITPAAATSSSTFAIKVSGGHLVDANGNVVQLRGVNVSGLEFVAIGGWDVSNPWGGQTGDATPNWATIKSWGVNAVRLPLNEASWLGLSCIDEGGSQGTAGAIVKADPGGNYQATVEKSVTDANAAGLYVILDLHWAAPNDNGTPACPTAQNAMADADHSVDFWTSIATQFKGNPAVIFELFNEPFLNAVARPDTTPWADLLNGGSVETLSFASGAGQKSLTWRTAGMQQMLNAVRATGAKNVVLTSVLQWAQQLDGWLAYKPVDSAGQLGAAWHPYPSQQYPNQASCVADGIITVGMPGCSALEMTAAQNIIAAGYPVVATEYGDTIQSTTPPWVPVFLPFADTNGISYLGWTWDVWTGASSDVLITDEAGDPTAGYGAYVKQHYLCRETSTTCQ